MSKPQAAANAEHAQHWALRLSTLAMALLTACGGGTPAGTTPTLPLAGVGSGGTGSTGGGTTSMSSGPITAFGSIVVNGVHFAQGQAAVVDADDQPLTPADLQLGMVVEVDGGAVSILQPSGKTEAPAQRIRVSRALLGPVDAIDVGGRLLTVMDQRVRISDQTRFDANLPQGLASLQAGDVVEVYGMHNAADDTFDATRIERKLNPDSYKVSGVLQDLDLVAGTCRIGQQLISYAWPDATANATLRNGQVVQGELYPFKTGGRWPAVAMRQSLPLNTADREAGRISGLVTARTNGVTFSINGYPIDASGANCVPCANLKVGDRLQAQGRWTSGSLKASQVQALSAY